MKRRGLIAILLVTFMINLGSVRGQEIETDTPPLLSMLALLPTTLPDPVEGDLVTVRFADYRTLYEVEGVEVLWLTTDYEALWDTVLPETLGRLAAFPVTMDAGSVISWGTRGQVGFEWLTQVERSLGFFAPPYSGLVIEGSFDGNEVAVALEAREFEQTAVNDVVVWHHYEDGAHNISERQPSDPFGGHMGAAARIALLPGYLANAPYWDQINDIISTAQGAQPSLADNPDYRALADAITAPEGFLIQAIFFNVEPTYLLEGLLGGEHDPTIDYGPLAPYALGVLADRQEGSDQVHLIGLVYPDAASAQQAAEEVAQRISVFVPPYADGTAAEQLGAQLSTRVFESDSTGNAVALIEARYPLPEPQIDPETGDFAPGGLLYRMWAGALGSQFYPLMVVPE